MDAEPLFAQGRIEILDHPLLARELKLLERRPRQVAVTALTIHGSHDHASALCLATALSVSMRPHLGDGELVNPRHVATRLYSNKFTVRL